MEIQVRSPVIGEVFTEGARSATRDSRYIGLSDGGIESILLTSKGYYQIGSINMQGQFILRQRPNLNLVNITKLKESACMVPDEHVERE
jgi:hypothetical protein